MLLKRLSPKLIIKQSWGNRLLVSFHPKFPATRCTGASQVVKVVDWGRLCRGMWLFILIVYCKFVYLYYVYSGLPCKRDLGLDGTEIKRTYLHLSWALISISYLVHVTCSVLVLCLQTAATLWSYLTWGVLLTVSSLSLPQSIPSRSTLGPGANMVCHRW